MTRQQIVDALVSAHKDGWSTEYAPADPRDYSAMITFIDTDGYSSIRALTFGEIADTIVEALELENE